MSRAELGDLVAFVELSNLIPVVYGLALGLREGQDVYEFLFER
jgi:hypothetical protein